MTAKTYYHLHPNSRYIKSDGTELSFVGGQLTTDDPEVIADLDAVIKSGASFIHDGSRFNVDPATIKAHEENSARAIAAAQALAKEAAGRKQ
jgi:hypothetical protein